MAVRMIQADLLEPRTLGDRLVLALRHLGWTGSRLAKETGIPKATLSRYTNDETMPPVPRLRKIARVLGVTMDDLVGSETDGGGRHSPTPEKLSRKGGLPRAA